MAFGLRWSRLWTNHHPHNAGKVSSALRPAAYISKSPGLGALGQLHAGQCIAWKERMRALGSMWGSGLATALACWAHKAKWCQMEPRDSHKDCSRKVLPSRSDSKPKSLKCVLGKTFLKIHVDKTVWKKKTSKSTTAKTRALYRSEGISVPTSALPPHPETKTCSYSLSALVCTGQDQYYKRMPLSV